MDIRKYFGSTTTRKQIENKQQEIKPKINNGRNKRKTEAETTKPIKRRKNASIFDSESDEDPIPTKKKTRSASSRRSISKSPIKTPKKQTPKKSTPTKTVSKKRGEVKSKSPVKRVDAKDFFGTAPVQRKKNEPVKKQKDVEPVAKKQELKKEPLSTNGNWVDIDDDSDFEETCRQLGPQIELLETNGKKAETINANVITQEDSNDNKQKSLSKKTPTKNSSSQPKEKEVTPRNKMSPGNAAKYIEYLNREGPRALGSKVIPEGEDNCLKGLCFVITGVLESIEREEATDLIKKYGGKVTQSLSKKTNFLMVGRDAGPSKLEKATKLDVKQIDEDGFLNMIATRKGSGKAKKSAVSMENDTPSKSQTMQKKSQPSYSQIIPVTDRVAPSTSAEPLPSIPVDETALLWVDKYKPKTLKQLIGQQGDRSNANKLLNWLNNWSKNNQKPQQGTKRKYTSARWASLDDGSSFKAALLSGPPGIGKTTTATLACKEVGLNYVELNASDTRSKRSLQDEVGNLLTNLSLKCINGDPQSTASHCLIMDEVDGMAGNEDRGGIQELIQLIKSSKVPVICICNDRNHQKIRSLSNYCFDLRFQRPRVEQLKGAMMSVCFKENIKVSPQALQEIIIAAQQDIRQIINNLSLWSINEKSLTVDKMKSEANRAKKDVKLNVFESIRLTFSSTDLESMNIHEKSDLFFYDYSATPLFVQENYIKMKPQQAQNNKKMLNLLSKAADNICDGDSIDNLIRRAGNWNLLPVQALFSSVIPGDLLKCKNPPMVSFPAWFGKNSRQNKLHRLSQELTLHTRLRTSANKNEILEYTPLLRDLISHPLRVSGKDGIPEAISMMQSYDLVRDDWDKLIDLSLWPNQSDPMNDVNSKIKAAFTRAYNSQSHLIPYAIVTAVKKSKKSTSEYKSVEEEEEFEIEVSDEDDAGEDQNVDNDAMVKVKKNRPSTSRERGQGRGRKKLDLS